MVTLITGGARSGKSSHALKLVGTAQNKAFIATAQALDEEMSTRIQRHKAEREKGWQLIEESIYLADSIQEAAKQHDLILIDCLTLWLFHLLEQGLETADLQIKKLEALIQSPPARLIFVTNEIGLGLVPIDPASRDFRDRMGFLNQIVANHADQVIFMVSGQPLVIKGTHEK